MTRDKLVSYLRAERAAGRWGYSTGMSVSPELVKPGEKVEVKFFVRRQIPAVCKATAIPDCFGANPGSPQTLKLDWQPDGANAHSATVMLTPSRPGNWRVLWQVGGEQLSRMIGVVDRGYAVCRFYTTNDHRGSWLPGHAPYVMHQRGLPGDFWAGSEWVSPFSRTPQDLAEHFRPYAEMRHRFGDGMQPLFNANYMIPNCPDTSIWKFDADVQREGIQLLMPLWEELGLGRLTLLGSYTFGHDTAGIARSLGIKAVDSACPWQNCRDGRNDNFWLYNDWVRPTVPYYVSPHDFRMVAPSKSIVALQQCTTSNVTAYTWMASEGCPQESCLRRHSDPKGKQLGETWNMDRFQTIVDYLLAEAPYQQEPLFLSVNFEAFVPGPDWDRANRLGGEYVCDQAKHKKVVFALGEGIVEYFVNHYDKQPENWFYWPDAYCGYSLHYKPKCLPDRIELSNVDFHSVHDQGMALPRFFWDFAQRRNEPVWDFQQAHRQNNMINPHLVTADTCVPRMVNLDGVNAAVKVTPMSDGAEIRVEIQSTKPLRVVPIGVWQLPLCRDGLKVVDISDNARYIAVVDGSTENAQGIVVCKGVPTGNTVYKVRLEGASRKPLEPHFHIGTHVQGRTFVRNGVPQVYIWLAEKNPQPGTLTVRVPAGKKIRLHYNDGRMEESAGGVLAATLDKQWQHESPSLVGLTVEELLSWAEFTPASGRVASPVPSVRIVLPGDAGPLAKRAGDILGRQIAERCGAEVVTGGKAAWSVELGIEAGIGTEGFKIADGPGNTVRILGNDERGLLYGVGKFLRSSRYDRGGFTLGAWRGTSVPKCPIRGIYLATHFNNYYEAASPEELERYVEDLSLWGFNLLALTYPHWQYTGYGDPAVRAEWATICAGSCEWQSRWACGSVSGMRSTVASHLLPRKCDARPYRIRWGGTDTSV